MAPKHALVIALFVSAFATSAHAEYQCKRTSSPEKFLSAFTGELERLNSGYKSREAARQAKLDRGAKAMVDSGAWSEADRSAFFSSLADDPDFSWQEQQKKYYNRYYQTELQFALALGNSNPSSACDHANNTVNFLGEMIAASEKQWVLMEERLDKAATAKGVKLPVAG